MLKTVAKSGRSDARAFCGCCVAGFFLAPASTRRVVVAAAGYCGTLVHEAALRVWAFPTTGEKEEEIYHV